MAKWSVAIQKHNNTNPKRVQTGDILDFKPKVNWVVGNNAEFQEIQRNLKDPNWLSQRKDEIFELYRLGALRTATIMPEFFIRNHERIWQDILLHGIRDPHLLPAEVACKFNRGPGASLWHRYGRDVWSYGEKISSLLVDIDEIEAGQMEALCESFWDTASYEEYAPMSFKEHNALLYQKALDAKDSVKALLIYENQEETLYNKYIEAYKKRCAYPKEIITKRRFCLKDLTKVSYKKVEIFDKLNRRNILKTDELQFIKPGVING